MEENTEHVSAATPGIGIAAVERDTGLSKDLLRVWERRYGFPSPARDGFGERVYPAEQVEKLRLLRRLMGVGHRPGKIIHLALPELTRLAGDTATMPNPPAAAARPCEDLDAYLDLVKRHQSEALRAMLHQALVRLGLARFVMELVAPLVTRVGEAWTRGWFEVFEEHLFTEALQTVLRHAINTLPAPGGKPSILLTTLPQEPHGLGLLMAEALFVLNGCACMSLGVQTPVWDIVRAAAARKADVVALSFSSFLSPATVCDGLAELRGRLAPGIEIWAGGSCSALQRRTQKEVVVLAGLADIGTAVEAWRRRAAGPAAPATSA
ncbi:MerR family transcriptional regulator [Derxia lacustris]|uniref:MerR family transcriptional regulator n=1 Tax=Derxia lacustris TaxID=764842 RepID=UPI000A17012F|nr:MerR family transcriptional regulator [Derxia lacustris]